MDSEQLLAAIKAAVGYAPSQFQSDILDWFFHSNGNAACHAVAGAGKSSTLLMMTIALQEAGCSPDDVRVMVFGKRNSQDLKTKFGRRWERCVSTLHSTGFGLYRDYMGIKNAKRDLAVVEGKYKQIAQEFSLIRHNGRDGSLKAMKAIGKDESFMQLINLTRQTNQAPTPEAIEGLVEHFCIEEVSDISAIAAAVELCLAEGEKWAREKNEQRQYVLDFTDQIWLPVKWAVHQEQWFKPYKVLLLDEAQDLNAIQITLALMLAGTGRILAVGDPRQSILGFSGADHRSYETLIEATNAIELPLSTCFRCPALHIRLVKAVFPGIPIEASPNADMGTIATVLEDDLHEQVQDGDLILCRKTAPLINGCIKLLAKGVPAIVLGRDIGYTLEAELRDIEALAGFTYQEFNAYLRAYREMKLQKVTGLNNEEELTERLNDRLESLQTLYLGATEATSIDALCQHIQSLFADSAGSVTFATAHKSKGLEAARVFILKPCAMPLSWKHILAWQEVQEDNLLYVALTRAKAELFIVLEDQQKESIPYWLPDLVKLAEASTTHEPGAAIAVDVAPVATVPEAAKTIWEYAAWQYPPEYIVSLGSRPTYYAAPTIDKLQVTGETAKQVKVLGHRNCYQHKVFCLPNDNVEATWKELLQLQEALDLALFAVAAKLKEFGHYPDRLAEYETFEEAPNPLSPSVINATNPDDERDYEYGLPWEEHSYFLHARRQVLMRHTAQMLRYMATGDKIDGTGTYEEEALTGQKGWFLCPTDADWDEYESLRQSALKAALALHQFLLPLGTYEQVRKNAATVMARTNVVEAPIAPKAALAADELGDDAVAEVYATVNVLQSGLSGVWTEATSTQAITPEAVATTFKLGDRIRVLQCSSMPDTIGRLGTVQTPWESSDSAGNKLKVLFDGDQLYRSIPPEWVEMIEATIAETSPVKEPEAIVAEPKLVAEPVWMNPTLIRLNLGTQPRAGGMIERLLKKYAREMKEDAWDWQRDIPTVLFDGRCYFPNGAGHHRVGAAALAEKEILVYLQPGTVIDAKLEAAKGEQFHSEGRTNKDKRNQLRIVLTDAEVLARLEALLGHPDVFPSDRAIADYCRVTAPTVASVIAELVEEGLLELPEERVGKDGRVQKKKKSSQSSESGAEAEAEDVDAETYIASRPRQKQLFKLYEEYGGAKTIAIAILDDLTSDDLVTLAEAIQARLEDDAE